SDVSGADVATFLKGSLSFPNLEFTLIIACETKQQCGQFARRVRENVENLGLEAERFTYEPVSPESPVLQIGITDSERNGRYAVEAEEAGTELEISDQLPNRRTAPEANGFALEGDFRVQVRSCKKEERGS